MLERTAAGSKSVTRSRQRFPYYELPQWSRTAATGWPDSEARKCGNRVSAPHRKLQPTFVGNLRRDVNLRSRDGNPLHANHAVKTHQLLLLAAAAAAPTHCDDNDIGNIQSSLRCKPGASSTGSHQRQVAGSREVERTILDRGNAPVHNLPPRGMFEKQQDEQQRQQDFEAELAKRQSRSRLDPEFPLTEQQRQRRDLNRLLSFQRDQKQHARNRLAEKYTEKGSFRDRFVYEHAQHQVTKNLLTEEQAQAQTARQQLLRQKEQNQILMYWLQEEQMQRQSLNKWLSHQRGQSQNLNVRLAEEQQQKQNLRGQIADQKMQLENELAEQKAQRHGLEQKLKVTSKQRLEGERELEHLHEVRAELQRQLEFQNDRINSARRKLHTLPDVQRQLQLAKEAEKKAQAEKREAEERRLASEQREAELLSIGPIAKGDREEVLRFTRESCRMKSAQSLVEAIKENEKYCRRKRYDLARGHGHNVSQLYRLLNEEVAELIKEIKQPRLNKTKVATEADDVLSYALQFIWEFKLQEYFDGAGTSGARGAEGIPFQLQESFLQLQCRAAENLQASVDGKSVLADLGTLPNAATKMADSVRAVNRDFNKTRLSNTERRRQLATSVAEIVWAVAELTALSLVDMCNKGVCGHITGKNKLYDIK